MTIRLLVSDVDGTLVRDDKTLSDGVVAAVGRLRAAGVAMALISARPVSGMQWIAARLALPGPLAAFNGGTIATADGTVLSAQRLDPDVAHRALQQIDRPGVMRWLFRDGRWHAEHLDAIHVARERKAANQEPIIGPFPRAFDGIDKIVAVSDDPVLLGGLEHDVREAIGSTATVIRSQTYYLDVTAPAANKGDGIVALAKAAGVSLEEVAAIGDQHNDLAMFARAGLSIAMGQGPEDVRRAANRITGSNEQDGVAQAIDRILLGQS
jgi:Cof subfamily protein (haloacid dehalogenase superfamily)